MENKEKNNFGKFLLGLGLGAGIGILFAPKKGSDIRKDLRKKLDKFLDDVDDLTINDVKKEFNRKVEEIKNGLDDLDKETILKKAKEKSEELKEEVCELINMAKEKGTPILENMALELKEKTISVANDVIEKLEK